MEKAEGRWRQRRKVIINLNFSCDKVVIGLGIMDYLTEEDISLSIRLRDWIRGLRFSKHKPSYSHTAYHKPCGGLSNSHKFPPSLYASNEVLSLFSSWRGVKVHLVLTLGLATEHALVNGSSHRRSLKSACEVALWGHYLRPDIANWRLRSCISFPLLV